MLKASSLYQVFVRKVLNPNSLKVVSGCKLEESLASAKIGENFQFMRHGYFCLDNKDSREGSLVFNRSVALKDSYKG